MSKEYLKKVLEALKDPVATPLEAKIVFGCLVLTTTVCGILTYMYYKKD